MTNRVLDKIQLIPREKMTPEYNYQLSPEARKKAVRAYQKEKLRLYHEADEKPAKPRTATKSPSIGQSLFITLVLVAALVCIFLLAVGVGLL